jgi:uncharacterized NAD-dependent epimerase/dehydratase family protein
LSPFAEGNAIVYCEGAFGTTNGKTAHGLVRRTRRYEVLSVIDSRLDGRDAGEILDGEKLNIPILADIRSGVQHADKTGRRATHLVVGLAPDGGRLDPAARSDIRTAVEIGLNLDSGLHDFLSEDQEILRLAHKKNIVIRDIRKTPPRDRLHFFTGKIEDVSALRVAVLGTDSAVGKRTTAWKLVEALEAESYRVQMIGTGQTAWMQGAEYCLIMDSLINDFVAGEIEHAIWRAWKETQAQVLVIEGQGSLMNPAYPGGFEILAAGRPQAVILQHAPSRREYDGFPGYAMHPLSKQIQAIEFLSEKPVVAIAINHEGIEPAEVSEVCGAIARDTRLPVCDPLLEGVGTLVEALKPFIERSVASRM